MSKVNVGRRVVKVTVIVERDDGQVRTVSLVDSEDHPLVAALAVTRDPVEDPKATEEGGGMWRHYLAGPVASIQLSATGVPVEAA